MSLPNRVKIGLYEYTVAETDEPILLNSQVCKGLIDYEALSILIKNDMPLQHKQQTLWHEIVHGIIKEWGVNLESCKEETIVEWLSIGIMQVIRDNPSLH